MTDSANQPKSGNSFVEQVLWPIPALTVEWIKRHATPYHLTVAAVLGGITAVFGALVTVLIIIATNFNVLGWME